MESRATRASLTELLSPQMGKDIVWFLRRWAKTYLLVDEKLYDQVSFPELPPHNKNKYITISIPCVTLVYLPSSDQHPPEHSVRCRHGGRTVDCGISAGESD